MSKYYLILFFCLHQISFAQQTVEPHNAPDLEFEFWFNGKSSADVMTDKPIIIEFWASWCTECIKVQPYMNELSNKYKNEITFIAVNSFDNYDKIKSMIDTMDFSTLIAKDKDQVVKNYLQVDMIPTAILIDKNGKVRWRGTSSFLTEEIIDNFLIKDTIIHVYNPAFNLENSTYTIHLPNEYKIEYTMSYEESDRTRARGFSYNFDNGFFIEFSNNNLQDIIHNLLGFSGNYNELIFEGNVPTHADLNLVLRSTANNHKQVLIEAIIDELSKQFHFKYDVVIRNNQEFNQITFL